MQKDDGFIFRLAKREDLEPIVEMLASDMLGAKREVYSRPLRESYTHAFDAISKDPNNEVLVACHDSKVVAVLQMTYIPSLTYQGAWRALVEGVRVHSDYCGQGLGTSFIKWAISRAQERRCCMVQLTTNKERARAKIFYERMGFVASHEGMKLMLS